jgi:hypothetical protein
MIAILIFALTALVAIGCFVLAWKKWKEADPKFGGPRWRSIVAFIGLCSVTAQLVLFVGMDAYGRHIDGWSHNYRMFNIWGRLDFYLFVVALIAVIFGKGRSRPWIFISSLAISGVWFMVALSR